MRTVSDLMALLRNEIYTMRGGLLALDELLAEIPPTPQEVPRLAKWFNRGLKREIEEANRINAEKHRARIRAARFDANAIRALGLFGCALALGAAVYFRSFAIALVAPLWFCLSLFWRSRIAGRYPRPNLVVVNGRYAGSPTAVGGGVGLVACALAGAKFGAGIGIAGGPLGAVAGTIPGALIGAVVGVLGGTEIGRKLEPNSRQPRVPKESTGKLGAAAGFLAGASGGAAYGASLGIVAGPLGAVAGTVPGAFIGGVVGMLSGVKVERHLRQR